MQGTEATFPRQGIFQRAMLARHKKVGSTSGSIVMLLQ
jgi:hypothetical protein